MMIRRISLVTAVILISITITSALNAGSHDPYANTLRASYAERFKMDNVVMYIEWIMHYDLQGLANFSDAIVYGRVKQNVTPLFKIDSRGTVFEVEVIKYIKEPEYADTEIILVSQIFGEAENPIIRPGDECIFFLSRFYDQNPGPDAIYSIGGSYTRYVVYYSRVYPLWALDPYNDAPTKGELLSRFITRIEKML